MDEAQLMFRFIYVSAVSFASVFVFLRWSGFFSSGRPGLVHVINTLPLYICSFIILLTACLHAVLISRGRILARLTLLVSMFLLAGGYWIGGLMGFSIEAVITEGQSIEVPGTMKGFYPVYVGKYAKIPLMTLTLKELRSKVAKDKGEVTSLEGSFRIKMPDGRNIDLELDSQGGYSGEGFSVSMGGFGYSPRYVLKDSDGAMLDSSFVYLHLYPYGTEDYFRLLSPLTYYLSYYPAENQRDIFHIRIVRNKDIVFDGKMTGGEDIHFENAAMSIPEIREWTMVRVNGNPGKPFLVAGFALLLAAVVESRYRALRGNKGVEEA